MANAVEKWVEAQAALTKPDKVYWVQGTEDEMRRLIEIGMTKEKTGPHQTFRELNPQAFANSYLHRSHPNDVARTEQLTFVCTTSKEEAGPNNNWMEPKEAKTMVSKLFDGCMKGRTLYVIPYMMGHPESPYAKPCIQITDSIYVVVSMYIMTRAGKKILDRIGSSDKFVKGLHSIGELDPNKRYIMHFPQEDLVMSIGSGYGGNALLGKKCFSLRIASYQGRQEGWLAEHMIIMGVEDKKTKETMYILGAFPSACGKTNLAMIDPILEGYNVTTLGDDISWINVGPDGRLYAINPEAGFFGVAPGTGDKTNPQMIKTLKAGKYYPTLFTNTGLDTDTNSPWWEGLTDVAPAHLLDWQGNPWDAASGKVVAHPNSRFTVAAYNCPTLSKEFDNPKGVPISAILFGGRRSDTVPLVCESFDWNHGVFKASSLGSETTTAAAGQVGVVRRDPMAMLPFCGYNMADYFRHWMTVGSKLTNPPKIFFVNWFKKNAQGKFVWPGFRDNFRVIKWMMDRVKGTVSAKKTPIGYMPEMADLNLSGLDISKETLDMLFEIKGEHWKKEIEGIETFYAQFGEKIPKELTQYLAELKKNIS
ncbi:MAG TPA: phosphoenolpyruvate carboxykinase (GTP) [Syntrophorhabdaceae bacterium]|nr:phosphoenolpyruvate carboxykinase (GTP) [Syntrophorhabdaceae bacterium]